MAMGDFDGLCAVEPNWSINLHFEIDEFYAGMVELVDLVETGVEAASERRTGGVEG